MMNDDDKKKKETAVGLTNVVDDSTAGQTTAAPYQAGRATNGDGSATTTETGRPNNGANASQGGSSAVVPTHVSDGGATDTPALAGAARPTASTPVGNGTTKSAPTGNGEPAGSPVHGATERAGNMVGDANYHLTAAQTRADGASAGSKDGDESDKTVRNGGDGTDNNAGDGDNGTDSSPVSSEAKKKAVDDPVAKSYDDMIARLKEQLERNSAESDEDRAKRLRREKSKRTLAALTDGLRALSNLYFTTKGAPNMYDPRTSAVRQVDKRAEMGRKAREAMRDARDELRLKIEQARMSRAKAKADADKAADDKARADAKAALEADAYEWQKKLRPDKERKAKGEADKAESDAKAAGVNAEMAQKYKQSQIDRNNRSGRGGGSGNYQNVQIVDPATGELVTVRVTGNKAAEIIQSQSEDNSGTTTKNTRRTMGGQELDATTSTTQKGKTAKQNNAEATRKAREAAKQNNVTQDGQKGNATEGGKNANGNGTGNAGGKRKTAPDEVDSKTENDDDEIVITRKKK